MGNKVRAFSTKLSRDREPRTIKAYLEGYGCSEDRVVSRDSVGRAWVWEMENRGTKDKGDGTIQKDLSLV